MKKLGIISLLVLSFVLVGCTESDDTADLSNVIDITDTSEDLSTNDIEDVLNASITEIIGEELDLDEYYTLEGNEEYLSVENDTITTPGIYLLEGEYDSTITINVSDEEDVELVLNNFSISVEEGPAFLILSADDVTFTSPSGTSNLIEDSSTHTVNTEGEDYNGAIYSYVDLVFNGTGSLTVNGNYNNAIYSKDDIKILETTLTVTSVDDGIVGRDYVAITEALLDIDVTGDAITSTNDENPEKGFVYIESGTFSIDAEEDGIQAVNDVIIYDGTFTINAGDNAICSDQDIYIGGGEFNIDAEADGLNAAVNIHILDGNITVSATDDGVHADQTIQIDGGTVTVKMSYEGIEGFNIYINGGTITVNSTDDGINGTAGGGQEHGTLYTSTGGYLEINGGIINVVSAGDGVDVNGDILMTDGYLIVFGSSYDNQSSIDYDETFNVTGGLVVAVGSTGMIQSVSTTSTQASLIYADTTSYGSGDVISLTDSDGNVIIELEAVKTFAGVMISSPNMEVGESYTLSIDGDETDFELSSLIVALGDGGTTMSGPGGDRPPGR